MLLINSVSMLVSPTTHRNFISELDNKSKIAWCPWYCLIALNVKIIFELGHSTEKHVKSMHCLNIKITMVMIYIGVCVKKEGSKTN